MQIHHIDEDPSNNDIQNLAALCLEDHNDTLLKGGFGRKLSPELVIRYRDAWLADVARRRATSVIQHSASSGQIDTKALDKQMDVLEEQGLYALLAMLHHSLGHTELRDKYIELALARDDSYHTVSFLRRMQDRSDLIPKIVPAASDTPSRSPLAFSVTADAVCIREEGRTELVGDLFLKCIYTGDVIPPAYSLWFSVIIYLNAQVTSRLSPSQSDAISEAVLLDVNRPGEVDVVRGIVNGNSIIFNLINLNDMRPQETRTFRITNIRSWGRSHLIPPQPYEIRALVTISGAWMPTQDHLIATTRPGLVFNVRNADNTAPLPDTGFIAPQQVPLPLKQIATLRFGEGFQHAFKTKLPQRDMRIKLGNEYVYTSESGSVNIPMGACGIGFRLTGVADHGTLLRAAFAPTSRMASGCLYLSENSSQVSEFGHI